MPTETSTVSAPWISWRGTFSSPWAGVEQQARPGVIQDVAGGAQGSGDHHQRQQRSRQPAKRGGRVDQGQRQPTQQGPQHAGWTQQGEQQVRGAQGQRAQQPPAGQVAAQAVGGEGTQRHGPYPADDDLHEPAGCEKDPQT